MFATNLSIEDFWAPYEQVNTLILSPPGFIHWSVNPPTSKHKFSNCFLLQKYFCVQNDDFQATFIGEGNM